MKEIVWLIGMAVVLNGCSWLHHGDNTNTDSSSSAGLIGGPDANPGRGTTGVGSGGDSARGITGSDAAPPR